MECQYVFQAGPKFGTICRRVHCEFHRDTNDSLQTLNNKTTELGKQILENPEKFQFLTEYIDFVKTYHCDCGEASPELNPVHNYICQDKIFQLHENLRKL